MSIVSLYADRIIGMHLIMAYIAFLHLASLTAGLVSGSGSRDAQVVTLLIWAKARLKESQQYLRAGARQSRAPWCES